MRLFHFISDQHALSVIANQRMKVSSFDDLNDPFELHAVDLSDSGTRDKFRNFKRAVTQQVGLLCFSKNWKSPLLWSHYANRHRGVALQFEVQDEIAHPVKYRKQRYLLDVNMVQGKSKFDREQIEAIWMSKYVQWSYEDEVRVLIPRSEFYEDDGLCFYDLGRQIRLTGQSSGPFVTYHQPMLPATFRQGCRSRSSELGWLSARLML